MPLTIDLNAPQVTVAIDSGTVTANRFVTAFPVTGGDLHVVQAGLGDPVFGVALADGDASDPAHSSVLVDRSAPVWAEVTAGTSLTAGDVVMSDADGKLALYDDDPTHTVLGNLQADTASGASGVVDATFRGGYSVGTTPGGASAVWATFDVEGFGITAAAGVGYRGVPLSATPNRSSGPGAPTLNGTNDGIIVDPTRSYLVIARVDFDTDTDGLMQVDVVGYPGGTGQQYVVAGEHIVSAAGFHLGAVVGGPPISLNIYADGAISNVYDGNVTVCSLS